MDESQDHYVPGVCNIGGAEIMKRKKELVASALILIAVTAIVLNDKANWWIWLLVFLTSAFTVLMMLQVRNHFCVRFGWFRKYNFEKVGNYHQINDPVQHARDRRKVLIILLESILISLLYSGLIYLLAQQF